MKTFIHDVLIARSSSSLQGPGFLIFTFRCRTKRNCNRHQAPLRPAHGFCRARATPSWLHPFGDHPHVLFVLGLVNRAMTSRFSGLDEILQDLICDQALFCVILLKYTNWSVLNAPWCVKLANRVVTWRTAAASSGFPLSAQIV